MKSTTRAPRQQKVLRHGIVFRFQPASTTNVYSAAALFLFSVVIVQSRWCCLAAARLFNRGAVVGLCHCLSAAPLLLSKGALVAQPWLRMVLLFSCCAVVGTTSFNCGAYTWQRTCQSPEALLFSSRVVFKQQCFCSMVVVSSAVVEQWWCCLPPARMFNRSA